MGAPRRGVALLMGLGFAVASLGAVSPTACGPDQAAVEASVTCSEDLGGYAGTWHADSSGNPVPDDCLAWASSSDNPMSPRAGLELCEKAV